MRVNGRRSRLLQVGHSAHLGVGVPARRYFAPFWRAFRFPGEIMRQVGEAVALQHGRRGGRDRDLDGRDLGLGDMMGLEGKGRGRLKGEGRGQIFILELLLLAG